MLVCSRLAGKIGLCEQGWLWVERAKVRGDAANKSWYCSLQFTKTWDFNDFLFSLGQPAQIIHLPLSPLQRLATGTQSHGRGFPEACGRVSLFRMCS